MENAARVGVASEHKETNFLWNHQKTAKQFLKDPLIIIPNLVSIGVLALEPQIALGFAAFRVITALTNMRLSRRYDIAAQLATSLSNGES